MSLARIIYIARNPKDTAVSLYYMMKLMPVFGNYIKSWNHSYQLFFSGKVGFGDWFDHVLDWNKHNEEDNIIFVKYEDMKKDIRATIKKIALFLDIEVTDDVMQRIVEYSSIKKMRENKAVNLMKGNVDNHTVSFIRKGIVGDWVNHFTVAQDAHFEKMYEKRMKGSGLVFDFY
uniref:Sulfotransferase family cytosolic 1B member 1-like n=1 Tax=Saccoglossus kowalevskii TaxID=10224 RepID=A0ABM0MW26_SACKO|nr:PREDICTED: sulfotransferase family cytosolic 1B member 1-like [Saccoglossus kowalevskii]